MGREANLALISHEVNANEWTETPFVGYDLMNFTLLNDSYDSLSACDHHGYDLSMFNSLAADPSPSRSFNPKE